MSVAPPGGQDRIMIYGPKSDGTYITEFRIADGESLAISVPAGETRVLKHFQFARALRAGRAGRSERNLWSAREFAKRSPRKHTPSYRPHLRVPETPPALAPSHHTLGRGSRFETPLPSENDRLTRAASSETSVVMFLLRGRRHSSRRPRRHRSRPLPARAGMQSEDRLRNRRTANPSRPDPN
jgi:hypothetical protein